MEVDPVTAKALKLDMQLWPCNKRMGVIMTDWWKAYQQAARDALDCKPQIIFIYVLRIQTQVL